MAQAEGHHRSEHHQAGQAQLRRARLAGAVTVAVLLLGGCGALDTDKTPDRIKNGTADLDLSVTGRPTPGTLSTVEQVLARLQARDADGLADLVIRDGDGTKEDAQRLITTWGEAADKPATADFEAPMKTAGVEVRFKGVPKKLDILLRYDFEDRKEKVGVILDEQA
ncbi:hypothetical protein P8605_35815 [Streptomyces sp. T-3]|nr:hypothetical protein [Streptomyces sp. T-3]